MLEQRFLTGGLDSDTAPHNMEKDALLNAVNIRTVVSKTQNSTNVQLIRGNVDCNTYASSNKWQEAMAYSAYQPNVLPSGYSPYGLEPRYVEKGKCVDGTDIYYFLQDYNETYKAVKIVIDATNPATPILVTTATAHLITNGDLVFIFGVTGNTNANGAHYAKVISPTTFELYGAYNSATTTFSSPIASNGAFGGTAFVYPNAYPFLYNIGGTYYPIPHESKIVKYDTLTGETTVILSEYWTDATLTADWYAITDNFIDCGVSDGKLFWCDPTPRYIDLSINYLKEYTNYAAGGELPTYSNGYNPATPLTTFSANVLSLITEPSIIPLEATRTTVSGVNSMVQFSALQFCVRFTNQAGFYSVLSPYSLTSLPERLSSTTGAPDNNNAINVELDILQKIPLNWQTVEFIVRNLETNSFYCIKSWDRDNATDKAEVDAHNAGSALTFNDYYGVKKYAIDSGSIAKQFDNVPLSAKSLALIANRLLLGDIIEGYDAPVDNGLWGVTATNTDTSTALTPLVSPTVYWVSVGTNGDNSVNRGTYVVRCDLGLGSGTKTYLLSPTEFYRARYKLTPGVLNGYEVGSHNTFERSIIFSLPENIHYRYLIETKNQDDPSLGTPFVVSGAPEIQVRIDIVTQSFANETFDPSNDHHFAMSIEVSSGTGVTPDIVTINIMPDPIETADGGATRAFCPNTFYNGSIRLYDEALRDCGIFSQSYKNITPFDPHNRTLVKSLDVQVDTATPLPSWAKYFSLNLSKEQRSDKTLSFVPDCIKIAIKNDNGEYKFVGREEGVIEFNSYNYIGVAIPVGSIVKYGYGYDYKSGDKVSLLVDNGSSYNGIEGSIIDYSGGYLIVPIDASLLGNFVSSGSTNVIFTPPYLGVPYMNAASFSRQKDVFCQLFTDSADTNQYEIAALGYCSVSGGFNHLSRFFYTNTDTIDINGDYYTQKRTSNTGAATMLAYQVNEGALGGFVVNDLGRVTPEDRIGQKSLPTGIRWSNTFIPSAQTNGYASFDALDIKILEPTAQEIVRLIPTTKGVTEGSQMLVLCKGGSFVTLVGKAQLFGADQQTSNVVSTTDVLGEVNPLQGNWTCNSPRSAVTYQGLTFWADSQNRDIIQFGANGAIPISSKYNCSRLFRYLFTQYPTQHDYHISNIVGSVNPYTNEYMVRFDAAEPAVTQAVLLTTNLTNPFDCYYSGGTTYIFNWNINKWICRFEDEGLMINVGDDVYSVARGAVTGFSSQWRNVLYHQFVGDAGVYYGSQHNAMIAVPFNSEYPAVKAPLAIRGDMSSYPNVTWIEADSMAELNGSTVGVANTQSWKMREGDAMATILRDRRSKGDISGNYTQAGISGNRLKGKVIKACLIWDGTIGDRDFTCGSVGLEYEKSSGHS